MSGRRILCKLARVRGGEPLPVEPHFRSPAWRLRLARKHLEAHAMLYELRGGRKDPDLPNTVTDIPLGDADAIGWEVKA